MIPGAIRPAPARRSPHSCGRINQFGVCTYPGLVHGFDNPRSQALRMNEGHPMQYNHAAAEDSYARAKAFLDRYVGHAGC